MDNSNSKIERDFESRIKKRDEETPSPEFRAKYIYDLIKDHNNNITNWDLLCFCSEYLGSQVLVYDWLERNNEIKDLVSRIQLAHYYRDEIPDTGII